jgi:hypothetical protein
LVYVSYNRKMENRFKKIRELGSKGKRSNPLLLEEFNWENEWVHESCEPVDPVQEGGAGGGASGNATPWAAVDEAIGATQALHGRNLPRAAARNASAAVKHTYNRKRPRTTVTQDIEEIEDGDHDHHAESDSAAMEADEVSAAAPTETGDGGFNLDVDLLN